MPGQQSFGQAMALFMEQACIDAKPSGRERASADASKQHRKLQSNERKRAAQSNAAELVMINSSCSLRL